MTLKTVAQAAQVLFALAEGKGRTVSELASDLGIARSSTHRILQTLAQSGLLSREQGRYVLGVEMVRLGKAAERSDDLFSKAQGAMKDLIEEIQETISLVIPRRDVAFIIHGLEPAQAVRCAVETGDFVELHAGAGSKALLMHLDEAERHRILSRALKTYTESTITDLDVLEADLAASRDRGWTFSDGEVTRGTRAVGAPVFNASGEVVASLCATAPTGRMTDEDVPRLGSIVKEAARRFSNNLGWDETDPS